MRPNHAADADSSAFPMLLACACTPLVPGNRGVFFVSRVADHTTEMAKRKTGHDRDTNATKTGDFFVAHPAQNQCPQFVCTGLTTSTVRQIGHSPPGCLALPGAASPPPPPAASPAPSASAPGDGGGSWRRGRRCVRSFRNQRGCQQYSGSPSRHTNVLVAFEGWGRASKA